TDEKRRGTLQYLLTTDLDTRHIILGKLLGRVAQVLLVALAGLPLFALWAGFGGVEPLTLLFVAAVLIAPLFALGSATVLASVRGWGALGGGCLGLSVAMLRPVYVRELESAGPARPHWYQADRIPVSDDPVRWREWHVEGLAPAPALRRVPLWLGVVLVAAAT